jgi:hypothetical protein
VSLEATGLRMTAPRKNRSAIFALERRTFRLSTKHQVVLFDRLPPAQQARLAPLRRDPEFYGVVVPRGELAPSAMIAASRDVALLLLTLQEPGPLPAYVADRRNPEIDRALEQLILDGILEIESEGRFVSGPSALNPTNSENAQLGHIAALSQAATIYASEFDTRDKLDVEARLYRYNYTPISPAWSARIPAYGALRAFLRIDHGPTAALINRRWETLPHDDADAWIQWMTRGEGVVRSTARDVNYKLYVSPALADLPSVFATVVEVLAEADVAAFKVGGTPRDVARPDKIVAYFRTRERALECGELLCTRLAGARVQGVPFSAEIGGDGLVSWGVDPADIPGREAQSSWRRWVCRRLAQYLTAAAANPSPGVPAWRFALERLRLDGIDTTTWEPDVTIMSSGAWGTA